MSIKKDKVVVVKGKLVGGNNKGISDYIRKGIIDGLKSKEGLDIKKLDDLCFKKFGVSKSGDNSRVNSIRWHLNKMKKKGLIEIV